MNTPQILNTDPTSAHTLLRLFPGSFLIRLALAQDPTTPVDLLMQLADYTEKDSSLRDALLAHPQRTDALRLKLAIG